MRITEIEKITKVLEAMVQYELALSDFYNKCGDIWIEEQVFWLNLAQSEVRHAKNIQQMREIITKKQEKFEVGRPFNLIALNTVIRGVQDTLTGLTSGEFSHEKMLYLAKDFEQSILESHYAEIVKTADLDYQNLMKSILSQTQEHKKNIQEKIDEQKTKT